MITPISRRPSTSSTGCWQRSSTATGRWSSSIHSMYGFWGEGHSWPYRNNPFPNFRTAERTWIRMFETQLRHWTKTPLVTNGQTSGMGGNSDITDMSIRTHNWLRKDTIYIGAEGIDMAIATWLPPGSRWRMGQCRHRSGQGITRERIPIEESIRANEGVTIHRQRHSARHGRGGKLLVDLVPPPHQRREHYEILRAASQGDR